MNRYIKIYHLNKYFIINSTHLIHRLCLIHRQGYPTKWFAKKCYIFVNKYRICKIQRVLTNILQSLQLSYKYIISLANMTVWQAITSKDKFIFSLATRISLKILSETVRISF